MSWSGRWIGGRAAMDQFVTVSAWSSIPSFGGIFPLAIQTIIYGNDSMIGIEHQTLLIFFIYYLLLAARFGLNIWSFVIFVKGTAVVQKFNYKKAILNVVLAVLVILIPIFIIWSLIILL